MQAQPVFDTKPLLRPDQLDRAREEIKTLEAKLSSPLIEDKGMVRKQLQNAQRLTNEQTPLAPTSGDEEGRMVARSKQLLSQILDGMPSQEEMRKAPPGAVTKHMQWESRNKPKIMEWKNLQLRLTAGSGDRDAANLEKFRPTSSSLNMDNAQIQGRNFFMPETAGPAVMFSDEQLALLRQMSPALADSLALMGNSDRQKVKETISGIGLAEPSKASVDGKRGAEKRDKRKARVLSQEQKDAMRRGREAAKAKKAA